MSVFCTHPSLSNPASSHQKLNKLFSYNITSVSSNLDNLVSNIEYNKHIEVFLFPFCKKQYTFALFWFEDSVSVKVSNAHTDLLDIINTPFPLLPLYTNLLEQIQLLGQ